MGFFSNLLRTGGRILGSVLGFGQQAAPRVARPVAAAFRQVPSVVRRGGLLAAGGAAFAAGDVALTSALSQVPAAANLGGGNGQTVRQTIVVTRDVSTGQVISSEVRMGAPFLMGRDVQIANRVFRQSTRLQRRLPKKLVSKSQRSMLLDRVVSSALERAGCPPEK